MKLLFDFQYFNNSCGFLIIRKMLIEGMQFLLDYFSLLI